MLGFSNDNVSLTYPLNIHPSLIVLHLTVACLDRTFMEQDC